MLEVLKLKEGRRKLPGVVESHDIIIKKYETVVEYNANGDKTEKRVPITINITKKINETKKLIKTATAEQKMAEIEKIFSK